MLNKTILAGLLIILSVGFLISCASTQVTGAWKDADYNKKLSNVLVIGVSDNMTTRRLYEDTLVSKFRKNGVKAVSAAAITPPGKKFNKETIKEIIKDKSFDAVIITRLIRLQNETQYVPPTNYVSAGPHYGSMYGYYDRAYGMAYDPGYMVDITIASLETNIYETAGEKLIWSMTTESFSPDQLDKIISELESLIFDKLSKDSLI